MNHVAYLVADLEANAERLRRCGCVAVAAAQPAVAYGGRHVQFFIAPLRFMIELIEAPAHRHVFSVDEAAELNENDHTRLKIPRPVSGQ